MVGASGGAGRSVDWSVHGALIGVFFIFAGWNVIGATVLGAAVAPGEHFPAPAFALLRDVVAACMMVAVAWRSSGGKFVLPPHEDVSALVALGVFGLAANHLLVVYALSLTSPLSVAVLQPLSPLAVTALGLWTRRESLGLGTQRRLKICAIVLSALGALVVVLAAAEAPTARASAVKMAHTVGAHGAHAVAAGARPQDLAKLPGEPSQVPQSTVVARASADAIMGGDNDGGGTALTNRLEPAPADASYLSHLAGSACAFLSVLAFAGYVVGQKPLLARHSSLWMTAWCHCVAAVALSVYVCLFDVAEVAAVRWASLPRTLVLALAYVVLLVGTLNYNVLAWANARSPSSTIALYQTLNPLFTALIAYFVLGTRVTAWQLAGGAMIVVALALNVRGTQLALREQDQGTIARQI